ncbi:MAG: Rieske (2Fe-2S) protein [Emcibacter sp.]|nr:Rieske (2Fe-2S) protein [Emcibacter sp.]
MKNAQWVKVENSIKLTEKGRMVFRHAGKQILLVAQEDKIFAVDNRCPHEGYPLSEGSLSPDCTLTCNWHNWKFDLQSGDTVVGGDMLRHYPVRRDGEGLWLDIQDAPAEAIQQKALDNIQASFQRYEYARMARELTRLKQAGGHYEQAVVDCIKRNYDRFEYGMGHAFGAAADWLSYGAELENAGREDAALVPVLEVISHIAWDVLREKSFPFTTDSLPYDRDAFLLAIEQEDEHRAVALVRGALRQGMTYDDLEPDLATAAYAHYNDFGHSVIYVYKTGQLIVRLGAEVLEPLLLSLIRNLIYASREDLIPEFRHYGTALAKWDSKGSQPVKASDFRGLPIKKAMDRMVLSSANVKALFAAIHETLAWNILYFDLSRDQSTDHPIARNVSWLSLTHGLTFANASRELCGRYPELWPQALLQMACFSGRNAAYTDGGQDVSRWSVNDPAAFFVLEFDQLLDHGFPEAIISCHRIKVLSAVQEDTALLAYAPIMLASANRYLNSPIKRKHSLRTAIQARQFVLA